MADPLLSIATLIERKTVSIDGKRYELRSPDELSVLDSHRFAAWAKKLGELQQSAEEEPNPEIEELVTRITRLALIAPDEVHERLSGVHRIAVAEVFTGLLLRGRMSVAGATAKAMGSRQTGDQLFRAFSDFTAETSGSGWRKRLLGWFGRT